MHMQMSKFHIFLPFILKSFPNRTDTPIRSYINIISVVLLSFLGVLISFLGVLISFLVVKDILSDIHESFILSLFLKH